MKSLEHTMKRIDESAVNKNLPHEYDSVLIDGRQMGVFRGKWLIRHVDLRVARGEIVTLIGPNGSGKSTCVKAVLGLIDLNEGHVSGTDKIRVGYVPQSLKFDHSLPLTVCRLMTLTAHHGKKEVKSVLDDVGIGPLIDTPVHALSGGEFQRALLARAILRQPDLLVLDEPVQGVDFSGEIALYELIKDIRNRLNCGILLVSHDLHIVMAETDRVICLSTHVCCSGTPVAVADNPEYQRLFGPRATESLAIYQHHHDHAHDAHGDILPLPDSKPHSETDCHHHDG